jgi:hypothetical protein
LEAGRRVGASPSSSEELDDGSARRLRLAGCRPEKRRLFMPIM